MTILFLQMSKSRGVGGVWSGANFIEKNIHSPNALIKRVFKQCYFSLLYNRFSSKIKWLFF